MESLPLLEPYSPDQTIAWRDGTPINCRTFLSDVGNLVQGLPEKGHAINLCEERYWFLVGFAAALSKGQTTLLPQSRAPLALEHLHQQFSECYCLTDDSNFHSCPSYYFLPTCTRQSHLPIKNPLVPGSLLALIAFTSGTTGQPRPCPKSWQSLVSVAQKTARNLGLETKEQKSIVATVPAQHMYGLETSIMLPIQHGWAFESGRPFFPEDVRTTLASISGRRVLVTTPLQLRACVSDGTRLPELDCIISATAPLPRALAKEAEKLFQTEVMEIYGFAEAGTLATRRPLNGETWELLEGNSIDVKESHHLLNSTYLPEPVYFPDEITPHGRRAFVLRGRASDLIKIGGHRISLLELNTHLGKIEGVEDGAFFLPDTNPGGQVKRLVAFVVSESKTASEILAELRKRIDPVFLPRPLYLVSELPRNAAGKLPREHLVNLLLDQETQSSCL